MAQSAKNSKFKSRRQMPFVTNRDNNWLDCRFPVTLCELNADGALEVPDFVPTKSELTYIATELAMMILLGEYMSFTSGATLSNCACQEYGIRRLTRAANLLGTLATWRCISEGFEKAKCFKSAEPEWGHFAATNPCQRLHLSCWMRRKKFPPHTQDSASAATAGSSRLRSSDGSPCLP